MKNPILPAVVLGALALGGCRSFPAAPAADPAPTAVPAPAAAGPAPDDNLNAVLWVQTAVEYDALATQTYRAAAGQLDRALADAGWHALVAEERGEAKQLPPAVVLDIDETVLDNSPYQARLVEQGAEYNETTWDAWVREQKARPVPGVLEFAKAAQARGVTLIYISNRAVHLKEPTLANLRAVGLPVKDDSVFLGLGMHIDGCEQEGSEKHCRRLLAGRQYRVLMQFGDQLGDFVQILANTPQGRDALYAEHRDWFGQRWWMLPNPTYGSWEPALFGNDFRQPREARREAKRAALELMR
jgi:5'-nucleotidase (lipoprotein e(P4) family)